MVKRENKINPITHQATTQILAGVEGLSAEDR
jgi:hypothetical protein